ncbi:MAG: AhpC/TSA family protein [Dysgonamonadaceae bacterium]|jgi:peroxiredoxin|nr:AhpC/TSA family protein [Dysgonamonadaceae bacterium]
MKKFILLAVYFLPVALFAQGNKFILQGKVGQLNSPAKVYLMYRVGDQNMTDSAIVKNGTFEFAGSLDSPSRANLILSHDGTYNPADRTRPDDYLSFFIEPVKIQVSAADSIKNALIKGSPVNDDNNKLEASLKSISEKMNVLMAEYKEASEEDKKSEDFQKSIESRYQAISQESNDVYKSFIQSNPNSFISVVALNTFAGSTPDVEKIEPVFNLLSSEMKNTKEGKAFSERINNLKKIAIGAIAPEFAQEDPDGKQIKLSDFRGKYLLIDFWASWCGPCRKENPNVVQAYDKYKNKNFEILGVSLDSKKDSWLAAIEKDGLTWPQVSDLGYWKNAVAQQYAVQSIPQNFLLDPNGKIIAKNLRGEDLSKKLAELLQ